MLRQMPARGFTLIELLVGLTILAILLALGAPAMGRYLQNSKLGSATSNYYAGVQLARAEAIRRNVRTQFVLTNTAVDGDIANATAAPSGRNWVVRAASSATDATWIAVDKKSVLEGEGSAGAVAIQVAGTGPAGFDGSIAFNGFGASATGSPYRIDITNPSAGTCAANGGSIRCRRITVSPGGQIAACDPAATATGDSRAC